MYFSPTPGKMDLFSLHSGRKFNSQFSLRPYLTNEENSTTSSSNRTDDDVAPVAATDKVVVVGAASPLSTGSSDLEKDSASVSSEASSCEVTWEGLDDKLDPRNWSTLRKWIVIFQISMIAFVVTFGSSIYSCAVDEVHDDFHVSIPVATLGSCVYLVGFGMGSMAFAPLSEVYGRLIVYLITLLGFVLFQIGGGAATNIQTLIIMRYFQGVFGSTPLANAGGTISDLFTPAQRTYVLPGFCTFPYLGPVLGSIIGSFIVQSKLRWRWCFWINMIWAGSTWAMAFFILPETHGPTILSYKAKYLREVTGNTKWHTEFERSRNPKNAIYQAATKSVTIICTEPIVVCFTLYLTLVYGVVYINFESYPIIFKGYGFNTGEVGLSFIGNGLGIIIAGLATPLVYKHYKHCLKKRNNKVVPEDRLYPLLPASFLLPISLFWFAWTSYTSVPWIVPIISTIFFGIGLLITFFVSYNYIIDSYQGFAASALSSATLVRYSASGGLTMLARPMFLHLGTQWAMSLLAFLAVVMVPIPFLFLKYGKRIRQISRDACKD
ncbi:fluconazole resistance protein [Schizosaccharomyces japonicus yFS275]|uniref:Fluconazole resistance protein n=1 Tax=Schizosaccharomyces japonicus (strain yFS275 / FY16936) TaxID=402676 RepID=B6K1P4_SCHJY|nr:fluconazole resistance protein [Schizosaccharomyces japonicus yFS275]EEB07075.1 fluconazole resistance protein [Schizosaccharomyces japonicus yFS275]